MANGLSVGVLLAVLSLAIGGVTTALGWQVLNELRDHYRASDILYSESPATFQLWVKERTKRDTATLPSAIAGRLIGMRLEVRRTVAAALLSENYLSGFAEAEAEREAMANVLLKGVLEALAQAPAEGDLWLAAARLQARIYGFDRKALGFLEASTRYSPRELDVAVNRLLFANWAKKIMPEAVQPMLAQDRALIKEEMPQALPKLEPAGP